MHRLGVESLSTLHRSRSLCLLLLLSAYGHAAQAHGQPPPATLSMEPPAVAPSSATVPNAPSLTSPVAAVSQDELRLPRSFRPEWAVDRSRVGDKLHYYVASTWSPRNIVEPLLLAGYFHLPAAPSQPQAPEVVTIASANTYQEAMDDYGHQMDAWRRTSEEILRYRQHRLEVGLATVETRQMLSNLALPLVLHQEARYRPAAIDASFGQRMANAATSIVLTHNDHDRLVPNYAKLGGTVAAAYIGKSVYAPLFDARELNSQHFFTRYVAYSLAGDLATNMAREIARAAIEPDVEVYNLHGRSVEDSYYPLSLGAKGVYWARSTYAARNFIQAGLTASLFSVGTQPVEPPPATITTQEQALAYDQAYVDYGIAIETWRRNLENTARYHQRRFIGGLAASETQMVLQNLIVPVAFNMEPRYIPLGAGYDADTRLLHAFKGLLTTRIDSGGSTINLPVLVGTVGGALLAKEVYYPALGTPALATNSMLVRTIALNLALDAVLNLKSEFLRHRGY